MPDGALERSSGQSGAGQPARRNQPRASWAVIAASAGPRAALQLRPAGPGRVRVRRAGRQVAGHDPGRPEGGLHLPGLARGRVVHRHDRVRPPPRGRDRHPLDPPVPPRGPEGGLRRGRRACRSPRRRSRRRRPRRGRARRARPAAPGGPTAPRPRPAALGGARAEGRVVRVPVPPSSGNASRRGSVPAGPVRPSDRARARSGRSRSAARGLTFAAQAELPGRPADGRGARRRPDALARPGRVLGQRPAVGLDRQPLERAQAGLVQARRGAAGVDRVRQGSLIAGVKRR